MLIVALAKIDGRFMTQTISRMAEKKEEVVKSEGATTKDGKIVLELANGQVFVRQIMTDL
jgi:hypothetical protein